MLFAALEASTFRICLHFAGLERVSRNLGALYVFFFFLGGGGGGCIGLHRGLGSSKVCGSFASGFRGHFRVAHG